MTRMRTILLITLGVLVGALLVPSGYAMAKDAVTQVFVTNTAADPVPIAGSVTGNVTVDGPVSVADDREPFEIRVDLNLPAGQAFGSEAFQVPAGKRLIVEFVSVRAVVPDGQTPLVGFNTQNGALGFPIHVDKQGVGNGNAFYNGSAPALDFASSGFYLIGLERQNPGGGPVSGSASLAAYVSGYLVPA